MTEQVNGVTKAGEFLSGKFNFFQISTVVPCDKTNVKTPLSAVLNSLNASALGLSKSITVIDGYKVAQPYISNTDYTDALIKQSNLDTLIRLFATRANPVMISVKHVAIDDGSIDFGSAYAGPQMGYYINIATEHSPLWLINSNSESNANGYQLLNAFAGINIQSTSTMSVVTDKFVVDPSSANLNIIATVRDTL